jgi:putative membrane protein
MEKEPSLNHSMDRAKKHYSSMFFLPSYKKALLAMAIISVGGVSMCSFAFLRSIESASLWLSAFLGLSLFALTILADILTSKIVLKADPIFIPRRILALSFYGWFLWIAFIALGTSVGYIFGWLLWVKISLIGFAAVVTLRIIVFASVSFAERRKQIIAMLLQPILCIVAFLLFWIQNFSMVALQVAIFIIVSPIIAYSAISVFLSSIDRLGRCTYSLPALDLFRAFILNWVTDLNEPLERQLEEMGENSDIEISILKFDAAKPKSAFIVPKVHPGPFKNIGSSLLPSILKQGYEKEFRCDACVPLGIIGHELDLASQLQNHRILSSVLSSAKFEAQEALSSQFVREKDGIAIASCQIFGDTAFLAFSLAPETTEDLPQELGRVVIEEAKRLGLKNAILVNAHNSLNDVVNTEQHLEELESAAFKCLKKVVNLPKKTFSIGSATVFPQEFTLKSGMGTGGITAIVAKVENQTTAYIIIDGNNMIPYLREKIIEMLARMGFDASEIFTTDTHAVSALETGQRGYHPVGEVMDHELLFHYITEVVLKAKEKLESSKSGYSQFVVPQVRVIGAERLNSVTTLIDRGMEKAKRIVFPIFGVEGLLLILLLLLF